MNYLKNLVAYARGIEPWLKGKRVSNGFLYFSIRPETVGNRDLYFHLKHDGFVLLGEACSAYIDTANNRLIDTGFKVDLSLLRVMNLRQVFNGNCGISREEAANDIAFLMSHGWDEARFWAVFNISRATLYRYKAKPSPNASATPENSLSQP